MKYVTVQEMQYLADCANNALLPVVNQALAEGKWGSPNLFDKNITPFVDGSGMQVPQPQYKFDPAQVFTTQRSNLWDIPDSWLSEFNRLKGDLFNIGFRAAPLLDDIGDPFFGKDKLISGPWIVGVNDPDTYFKAYQRQPESYWLFPQYTNDGQFVTDAALDALGYGFVSGVELRDTFAKITAAGNITSVIVDGTTHTVSSLDVFYIKESLILVGTPGSLAGNFTLNFSNRNLFDVAGNNSTITGAPASACAYKPDPANAIFFKTQALSGTENGMTGDSWARKRPVCTKLGRLLGSTSVARNTLNDANPAVDGQVMFKCLEFHYAEKDSETPPTVTGFQEVNDLYAANGSGIHGGPSYARPTTTLKVKFSGSARHLTGTLKFLATFTLNAEGINDASVAAPTDPPAVDELNLTSSEGVITGTIYSYTKNDNLNVWHDYFGNVANTPVYAQIYNNDGTPTGTYATVYKTTATAIYEIAIALDFDMAGGDNEITITLDKPSTFSAVPSYTHGSFFYPPNALAPDVPKIRPLDVINAVIIPTDTRTDTMPSSTDVIRYVVQSVFATANTAATSDGIHPSSAIKKVAVGDAPEPFTFGEIAAGGWFVTATTYWALDNPLLKGIWKGISLPVPAINCFLNQDIPPYEQGIGGLVLHNQIGTGDYVNPTIDSAFAPAPLQPDGSTGSVGRVDIGKGYTVNSVYPAIAPQPSKWLTQRDCDLIPLDRRSMTNGKSQATSSYWSPGILTPNNGESSNWMAALTLDSTETGSISRLFVGLFKTKPHPGWTSGVFGYNAAATADNQNLQAIWANNGAFDGNTPATWLGNITGGIHEVTGSDLADIKANGLNIAIRNSSTTADSPEAWLYVEIIYADSRDYLRSASGDYILNDLGGSENQSIFQSGNTNGNKLIPQSGYCIFKLRATRLPQPSASDNRIRIVPNSGNELTVTVGQWRNDGSTPTLNRDNPTLTFTPFLAADGVSPLTLTIPATGRDSDDVDVFLPVLFGNEIAYQCDEQIMLEAWANFQPVWFNQQYGGMTIEEINLGTLSFMAFWLPPQTYRQTVTTYPLCRAVWADTVKLLGGDPTKITSSPGTGAGSTDVGAGNDYPTSQI